jgi:Tol biopolymer transport system component
LAVIAFSLTVPAASAQPACLATYAFTNLAPGGSSIALRTNCGNTVRQLTSNGQGSTTADDSPSLSPDGQTVAFRHNVPGTRSEIFIVSASGGQARQVTSFGGLASAPSWSPDSKRLVFAEQTDEEAATSNIFRINADGTGAVALTSNIYAAHPAWCRNGQIAFGVQAIGQSSIYRMSSIDGSGMTVITTGGFDSYPAWSPDCQYVFFQRSIANAGNIYTVPVSGGQSTQLTFAGNEAYPSVSGDWTLAYTHITTTGAQIYTQWLGGTQTVAQPLTSVEDLEPSFQPGDGSIPAPTGFPPAVLPFKYVALGDSYSAGEGIPPFEAGTDLPTDQCHRSPAAYPRILAQQTRLQLIADRACSGATTVNIIGEGQFSDEPNAQIVALTHDTKFVTLSVGGNDVLFGRVLRDCVLTNCKLVDTGLVRTQLVRLASALPGIYRAIRAATSPDTKILVVGYPQIFPDPDQVDVGNCADVRANRVLKITGGEMTWIREKAVELDNVIRTATRAVPGTVYVDPLNTSQSTFQGHEICTRNSWFNGIIDPFGPNSVYSFHPNALGQLAYARLVETYL